MTAPTMTWTPAVEAAWWYRHAHDALRFARGQVETIDRLRSAARAGNLPRGYVRTRIVECYASLADWFALALDAREQARTYRRASLGIYGAPKGGK